MIVNCYIFGQSSSANNAYLATKYLGWNTSNGVNPLLFKTNNIGRMLIGGDLTSMPAINGYSGTNRSGYVLMGDLNVPKGPFSILHLNGVNGNQEFGYRPWMKTGITLTDNGDFSYMGMRQVGTIPDITETTIAWADNGANLAWGIDEHLIKDNQYYHY